MEIKTVDITRGLKVCGVINVEFHLDRTASGMVMQGFFIPGQPIGYYAAGSTPNWNRLNQYHAYGDTVKKYAIMSGLQLPLFADAERHVHIFTTAYFSLIHKTATGRKSTAHSDPDNVRKGIVDFLFYNGKGGDKYTGGGCDSPRYSDNVNHIGCHVVIIRPKSLVELGGVRKELKEQTPFLPGITAPGPKKKRWNRWKRKGS